ncbi:1122_t:CDS:2 [Acaulospora morrowiae]|uniref:1122_t:CDS:1 n=1 Tax=Acaulospora morrowiae TaxID=94023 RepID=A0A9N8YVW8_9GLOM|nr:1122_t:CDS:2 [Acaulospora morrowiae]
MDIDPQTQTLRELALKSKTKTRTLPIILDIDEPTTSQHHTNETPLEAQKRPRKHKLYKEKSDDIMENRVLSKFKKLESAILNFNDRLNSVTNQVHDTRHKVETDKTWPELDLVSKSRDLDEVIIHIDRARKETENSIFTICVAEGYGWDIASALPNTQDEWMKGKMTPKTTTKILTCTAIKTTTKIPTNFFVPIINSQTVLQRTQVDVTSAKVIDTLPITALQIQTETPNIIKITIPTIDQEAMTPIRINIAKPKMMQSAIDYTRALQHLSVTGRLHIKEHVQYWKEKIHAPDLIINWLRFGIPLFLKNLLHLTKQPDPPQYPLTDTQML